MKTQNKLALAIALALTAGSLSTAAAQSAADFQDEEYYKSGGLDLINAAEAYAAGYTGNGVTLGICDQPINFLSPEFTTKTASSMAVLVHTGSGADGVYSWSDYQHGTHVAGIAAASRNGTGMQGVAYDAEIVGTVPYTDLAAEVSSGQIYDAYLNHPEIKVINNSWGEENYLDSIIAGGMTMEKGFLSGFGSALKQSPSIQSL